MQANLIILFAKAPIPGRVKTRLLPVLTPEQATDLHTAFVADMLSRFRNCDEAALELHTDIETDAWNSMKVARKLQITGDLGLKMIHSLAGGLHAGFPSVVLLGSDAPTLPVEHVRTLMHSSSDVALGPTRDGGFYAIAARRVHSEMFQGVQWSRPDTLTCAIQAISQTGLTVEIGPSWFDIDEPADLAGLQSQIDLPPQTEACLRRLTGSRKGTC